MASIDPPPAAIAFAHDWAEHVVTARPAPVRVAVRSNGWGLLQHGRSIAGGALRPDGADHATGLGTHAGSELVVHAERPIRRLRALAGVDRNPLVVQHGGGLRLVFTVECAGKALWSSGELHAGSDAIPLDLVPPAGSTELVLRVVAADGNQSYAHADWADARVELDDGSEHRLGTGPFADQVPADVPFSFRCDARPSREVLPTWTRSEEDLPPADGKRTRRVTWRDPASGMACRLDIATRDDAAAVEWVVRFAHEGSGRAPLLEDIQALDEHWSPGPDAQRTDAGGAVRMVRAVGSPCERNDFLPVEETLPPGGRMAMAAGGGRSSKDWLPFFDLMLGDVGVTTAIGWTGQWACSAAAEADGVSLRAGMERTSIRLQPGEEIRTPRILQLFWSGDRVDAHNRWRRLLLDHYVPRGADGAPVQAPASVAHWGGIPSAGQLERIAELKREKLGFDLYWMDAGWYGPAGVVSVDDLDGEWAWHAGDWRPNPGAHPQGLRPLSDAMRAAGMGFMLWFEPERAVNGTPWSVEHPQWFLGKREPRSFLLLDLGNPEARAFVTDHLSRMIGESGIACYRQDFNIDPLPYWQANDAPERIGMTEIRHIEGLYAMWDELRRRHPGLLIDNCASGGRRIDLETISRSIPLWRSDWACFPDRDPTPLQSHAMGLSWWIPLHGTGTWTAMPAAAGDTYRARCAFGPATMFAIRPVIRDLVDPAFPWDWERRMLADWRRLQPLYRGDFYPLTGIDPTDGDSWLVYQMDRPDLGQGCVIAFRRSQATWSAGQFRLRGLDPQARYTIEDLDGAPAREQEGAKLLADGLTIDVPTRPGSRILVYRRR